MTIRAVMLGLMLGLSLTAFTHFNDFVIRQTMLVGNFFPISVFGALLLLLLGVNPLLAMMGKRLPLRTSELAVLTAVFLAACGWPGSNYGRYIGTLWTMPSHWLQTNPSWQAHHVMSYLPGGSAELGQGHVRDWPTLARAAVEARDASEATAAGRIWDLASPAGQRNLERAAGERSLSSHEISQLTRNVNAALRDPAFYQPDAFAGVTLPADGPELVEQWQQDALAPHEQVRLNRLALAGAMPELVLPPPPGEGGLVLGGRSHPEVIDELITGKQTGRLAPVEEVPWAAWWPTLRLWGGAILLLSIASVCLALVVHPQWSQRELLPYPIPRFVEEVTQRNPGALLPNIARSRMFWGGLAGAFLLHLLNGLDVWLEWGISIDRQFDFRAMRDLFPNASRVPMADTLFHPTIYLSVVGFAFLINRSVSLSLGLAHVLFVVSGSMLVANGIAIEYDKFTPNKTNMLRTGSFLGMALMILYTGRHYYLSVAANAVRTLRPQGSQHTPTYALWAARVFTVTLLLGIYWLTTSGMDWLLATLIAAMCMVIWLVISRIVCETGTFFIAGPVLPMGVLPGLLGYEAIGPTGLLLMGIAGIALIIDPREAIMPYIANALQITDRAGVSPRRASPWLILMVVVGLPVATVATLTVQYEHGAPMWHGYTVAVAPNAPFEELVRTNSESLAQGTLSEATFAGPLERLTMIRPQPGSLPWLGIGLALVIGVAAARLRLPWWPLHPVIFLVWGTWPIAAFATSFFLAWAIKTAVVRFGGSRGYEAAKPMMFGLIGGELLGALLWVGVGTAYFFITGIAPESYAVFP